MAKILRTLVKAGWMTKGAQLTAEEMDDNLLALEDGQGQAGTVALEASSSPVRDGWAVANSDVQAGSPDYSVDLADVGLGAELSLAQHVARFTPDGSQLVIGQSSNQRMLPVNVGTWDSVVVASPPPNRVLHMDFSAEKGWAALIEQFSPYLHVYNINDWSLVQGTPSLGSGTPVTGLTFIRGGDGIIILYDSSGGHEISLVNTDDWTIVSDVISIPVSGTEEVHGVDASPDGQYIGLAHDGESFFSDPHFSVHLQSDFSNVFNIRLGSFAQADDCAFSPDSTRVAVGHADGITVFEVGTWVEVSGVAAAGQSIVKLNFSPDGKYLACGTDVANPNFLVYETTNWTIISNSPGGFAGAGSVDMSPDSKYLALCTEVVSTEAELEVYEGGGSDLGELETAAPSGMEYRVKL